MRLEGTRASLIQKLLFEEDGMMAGGVIPRTEAPARRRPCLPQLFILPVPRRPRCSGQPSCSSFAATLSSSQAQDACEGPAPPRHVEYFHTEDHRILTTLSGGASIAVPISQMRKPMIGQLQALPNIAQPVKALWGFSRATQLSLHGGVEEIWMELNPRVESHF